MNFNEWKKQQAEKLSAVMSHDAPEAGEGLKGESMSSLPNQSGDFPLPAADLGNVDPAHSGGSSESAPDPASLPTSVSTAEIQRDAVARSERQFGGGE